MPYDPSVLAEHCDGDSALIRRVIDLFLADYQAECAALRSAFDRRDAERLYSLAHSIRGAAATFGTQEVTLAAREVETCCRQGRLDKAEAKVEALGRLLHALARELEASRT